MVSSFVAAGKVGLKSVRTDYRRGVRTIENPLCLMSDTHPYHCYCEGWNWILGIIKRGSSITKHEDVRCILVVVVVILFSTQLSNIAVKTNGSQFSDKKRLSISPYSLRIAHGFSDTRKAGTRTHPCAVK